MFKTNVPSFPKPAMSKLTMAWSKLQFSASKRIAFYQRMIAMLSNGVPLEEAIDEMYMTYSDDGKKPNHPLALVFSDIAQRIRAGDSFHIAAQRWIPRTEVMMLSSAETDGAWADRMRDTIMVMEVMGRIKFKIIQAVSYPLVLMAISIFILVSFSQKVVPMASRMLPAEKWTGNARFLYLLSDFFVNYGVVSLICLFAVIAWVVWALPNWTGRLRIKLDNAPGFSIYKLYQGASFFVTLGGMCSGGTPILDSLDKMRPPASRWMRQRLDGARMGIRLGHTLGISLKNSGYNFPDKESIRDLIVYSKFHGLGEQISIMAKRWLKEGEAKIDKVKNRLFSLGLVMVALSIVMILLGQFSMNSQVQAAQSNRSHQIK